jgi:biopolymer transport protein ExbD
MSEKKRFLDVWIIEGNTVYREVPYLVVTDWIQQGRLLEDDRLRPSGTQQWYRLGSLPAFAAFLPQPAPYAAEDRAEALEPIELDVEPRKRRLEDVDDDPDMIPLIDISLVLLIFFMMTASVGGAGSIIPTPSAQHKLLAMSSDMIWIGMVREKDDSVAYSLGKGEGGEGESFADRSALLKALDAALKAHGGPARVSIRADRRLPYDEVRDMTAALEDFRRTGAIVEVLAEVSEREP